MVVEGLLVARAPGAPCVSEDGRKRRACDGKSPLFGPSGEKTRSGAKTEEENEEEERVVGRKEKGVPHRRRYRLSNRHAGKDATPSSPS